MSDKPSEFITPATAQYITLQIQGKRDEEYLVGSPDECFSIAFDRLMNYSEGVIALLEYGELWRVFQSSLTSRSLKYQDSLLWIESSGSALKNVRIASGDKIISVPAQALNRSRVGWLLMQKHKHSERRIGYRLALLTTEAIIAGTWKNGRQALGIYVI
jgi:hypothetical protein